MTRILHITRNLPPLVGGMERLNWHIADELSRLAAVQIIGPQGSAALPPPATTITEVPLRPLPRFLFTSAWQALRIARAWQPNMVLAGSGLTAPAALLAARAARASAHVYLHGLDAAVQHPLYRAVWHNALRRMDSVLANSQPTAALAQTLGIAEAKIHIVHPGVQLPDAPQSNAARQAFREQHNLGTARLLVSIGRLTTRKGLREFVEHALPTIVQSAPDVLLVVIGAPPTDSLHATAQTPASIQALADAAGIGHHLRFLGMITDAQQLACAYESAALHIFPVRHLRGDPEGFGMVAIEAAAHGIATVAFATGGIVDAVAHEQSGLLVTPGDYPALARAVLQVLDTPPRYWQLHARQFAQQFAWPLLGAKILAAMRIP